MKNVKDEAHVTSDSSLKLKQAALVHAILADLQDIRAIKGPHSPHTSVQMSEALAGLQAMKGRTPFYPYVGTGRGNGAFVELLDGSVKLDFISGIGIYFFGRGYPAFIEASLEAAGLEPMQGNLEPSVDATLLLHRLIELAGRESQLKHGWTFCSGTMANENALKIIRQKKFPATRVFAFQDCFAGRSSTMAEITDNPSYRDGLPLYGAVSYIPFYREDLGVEASLKEAIDFIEREMRVAPNEYAALMVELVQGEGGVRWAPKEYFRALLSFARSKSLAVWVDEVQTFGRLKSLFGFEEFEVGDLVDVVTVGKLLQVCATLYTEEFNPRPGLIAGTFTGSTASFRIARKTLEILTTQDFYGEEGRIARLSDYFYQGLKTVSEKLPPGSIAAIRANGGMVAFQYRDGDGTESQKLMLDLFKNGLITLGAGHGPYVVRMLPPMGVLTTHEIDLACEIIYKTLLDRPN